MCASERVDDLVVSHFAFLIIFLRTGDVQYIIASNQYLSQMT